MQLLCSDLRASWLSIDETTELALLVEELEVVVTAAAAAAAAAFIRHKSEPCGHTKIDPGGIDAAEVAAAVATAAAPLPALELLLLMLEGAVRVSPASGRTAGKATNANSGTAVSSAVSPATSTDAGTLIRHSVNDDAEAGTAAAGPTAACSVVEANALPPGSPLLLEVMPLAPRNDASTASNTALAAM